MSDRATQRTHCTTTSGGAGRTRPRGRLARAALVVVGVVAIAAPSAAAAGGPPATPPGGAKGQAAIDQLGTRLPATAARYGMSSERLESMLREDATLRVTRDDALLYVEEAPEPSGSATAAEPIAQAGPYPDDQTFLLHSKPGSNRTIYLDFDGFSVTGSGWTIDTGGTCYASAYDENGDPSTFSSSEMSSIQYIFQRISEDYAPFDVDVTTQDPGAAAITRSSSADQVYGTRVVFTESTGTCPNGKTLIASLCGNCGGIAYIDVFATTFDHPSTQPAFVFSNMMSSSKSNAEAGSHEAGHNLGLYHDGVIGGSAYYSGQGVWAPIMGVGYYVPLVQWSKGEYTNANNDEDDLAIIAASGAPLRADDHGNTAATATTLVPNAPQTGIISTRTDVDAFSFTTFGDTYAFTATPAPTGPNLDIELEIRDAANNLVAVADPPSTNPNGTFSSSGLAASITATLPAGTYTAFVDGVGWGNPATNGYSDYASLGAYTLTATVTAPPPGAFGKTAPANNATGTATTGAVISWGASSGAGGYEYCVDATLDNACNTTWVAVGTATSATLGSLAAGTTYEWQVRALGDGGATYADSATPWRFTTAPPPGAFNKTAPANNATGIPNSGTTLTWGAASGATSYEYCIDAAINSSCNSTWVSVGAATSATTSSIAAGLPYEWQVRAVNSNGSTYANTGTWWRFTGLGAPGAFNTVSPAKGATKQSVSSLTLAWNAAPDATGYEYCADTTSGTTCTTSWVPVGTATSTTISGLLAGKKYFWQVRATNANGTTYANAGVWWYFTTIAAPGAFAKKTPSNGVTVGATSTTLTWGASARVERYEYCVDTTNNNNCDTAWVSVGTARSKNLTGLTPGTTYYWHVRAVNAAGTKYSNSNAWWRFTA